MHNFKFAQPETAAQVFDLMKAEPLYMLIAGGTDVMVQLKTQSINPKIIIDLGALEKLKGIHQKNGWIEIGAGVTFTELVQSLLINEHAAALAQAAHAVGSPQIRNRGTIGGNIVNASPAADTVTALVALDAEVQICSARGERSLLISELLCGVGKTTLLPGEIVTMIRFKIPPHGSKTGFIKLGRRKALAIARMNLAMTLTISDQHITHARVALGAVGSNPMRFTALEDCLLNQRLSDTHVDAFAEIAETEVRKALGSRASAPYKRKAVMGIARHLLNSLIENTEGK
jgi:CO/xanthine dehydrogenase FAD-binding subunit